MVQDELPDVVLPVKSEQLQLEDIMGLKWRMVLQTEECRGRTDLLREVIQLVVQVRSDAVVLGYQGNSGPLLLAGQPEAVGQRSCQRLVLVPLLQLTEAGGETLLSSRLRPFTIGSLCY